MGVPSTTGGGVGFLFPFGLAFPPHFWYNGLRREMRKVITDAERVAKTMGNLVSDLRLDLELVAMYLYQISPNVTVNRILLMADLLKDEKEEKHNEYDYL